MKNNHRILAVGSMAFDSIQTLSGKAEHVLGGSVNYFSAVASHFTEVSVIGVVGQDFPKSHLDWMSGRGIDISGVEIVEGKTFHWVGEYDNYMNEAKTLSTALNVFEHFSPKLNDIHKEASVIFLANIDPVLQKSVLDQANNHRFVACDSMNFWIAGKRNELLETLKQVDLLSINEGEAYLLSEQKNLIQAANTIRDMGPSTVVIKRGEYGAAVFGPKGAFVIPAFLVPNVIDPTGAGDTFAGGMIGYLARNGVDRDLAKSDPEGWDRMLRRAALSGCVSASFTVEDFSLHRLIRLEDGEIANREKQLIKMINIPG